MLWVERLTLTNFRNYAHVALQVGPEPQVFIGANGAGKTNLLEAVSLLAPGQGMRRAAYSDLARGTGDGGWAVAAHTHTQSVRSTSEPGCWRRTPRPNARGASGGARGANRSY